MWYILSAIQLLTIIIKIIIIITIIVFGESLVLLILKKAIL
jgi:hypothetical protein